MKKVIPILICFCLFSVNAQTSKKNTEPSTVNKSVQMAYSQTEYQLKVKNSEKYVKKTVTINQTKKVNQKSNRTIDRPDLSVLSDRDLMITKQTKKSVLVDSSLVEKISSKKRIIVVEPKKALSIKEHQVQYKNHVKSTIINSNNNN